MVIVELFKNLLHTFALPQFLVLELQAPMGMQLALDNMRHF